MRKRLHWMGVSSLLAVGFTFALQLAAPAQDKEKPIEINIVKKDGAFVFADPDAKISAKQSIKWVAKAAGFPHNLIGNPASEKPLRGPTGECSKAPRLQKENSKRRASSTITARYIPSR